jgi:hypothetical protein
VGYYVLVLNNDTVVEPHMVSRLVEVPKRIPIQDYVQNIIISLGLAVWFGLQFLHSIYILRQGLHLKPPIRPVEEVDFVSNCGSRSGGQSWRKWASFPTSTSCTMRISICASA